MVSFTRKIINTLKDTSTIIFKSLTGLTQNILGLFFLLSLKEKQKAQKKLNKNTHPLRIMLTLNVSILTQDILISLIS